MTVTMLIPAARRRSIEQVTVSTTWEQAITGWASFLHMRGLSANTIKLRRDTMRYLAARIGPTPASITEHSLIAAFSDTSWSPEYRKSLRSTLRSFCEFHRIPGADCIPPVKPPRPHPRPATDAVWASTVSAADPVTLLMARLAAEAGLRRCEVAAVHTDDLTHDGDGYALIVLGKGHKQRVVPITDELGRLIATMPPGWLFPSTHGGHLTPGAVGKRVSGVMPNGWTMHKLRHRYATRGYAATHDIRAVQEALGHASVATTQIYTAVSSRHIRAVSEAAARP